MHYRLCRLTKQQAGHELVKYSYIPQHLATAGQTVSRADLGDWHGGWQVQPVTSAEPAVETPIAATPEPSSLQAIPPETSRTCWKRSILRRFKDPVLPSSKVI